MQLSARGGIVKRARAPAAVCTRGAADRGITLPSVYLTRCVHLSNAGAHAQVTDVYVLKRPWVDHFLVRACQESSSLGQAFSRNSHATTCTPLRFAFRTRWAPSSR